QTSRNKAAGYPDVPTLPDLVPGFSAPFWLGLFAPADTPRDVVAKLNSTVNAAIVVDSFKEHAGKTGLAPLPMTREQFVQYVKDDTDRWAAVIKTHNIKAE